MILMLVGFVINYITLVNGCHRGKIPKFNFKKLKKLNCQICNNVHQPQLDPKGRPKFTGEI